MVDTNLPVSEGDPLGANRTSWASEGVELRTPSISRYSMVSTRARFLTVMYSAEEQITTPRTALIPWTNNYETALTSAREALQQYFPVGTANQRRWLASRVQTSSGVTWGDLHPELFAHIVEEPVVELRLCEHYAPKLNVTVLPIGHERMTTNEDVLYKFKIITIGSMSVGKSMMLQYFTKPTERHSEILEATLNPRKDVVSRLMTADGVLIKTVLWDTAGEERYRAPTTIHYRGANGVLLVYSITDQDSFRSCTTWLAEIREHVDGNVPIMLIGNQIDRGEERVVNTSDGQAFALRHGLLFTEISGKQGTNVEQSFQKLVHEIHKGLKDRNELDDYKETRGNSGAIGLGETRQPTPGGCKC